MKTMRAIAKLSDRPDDLGPTTVPIPEPGEHQLLVRVHAIGVGIHDGYFLPEDVGYPYPIGIEGAGVIEAVGGAVTGRAIGERIAFVSAMQAKGGTWAELAVVDAGSFIVPIPTGMTFVQAAALPVAGNTVLKAFHALEVGAGDSVFIAGASGAIGTLAIQLAVDRGCAVAGSASPRNHAYMRALGAAATVDYHEDDWVAQVKRWAPEGGVDAALAIQPGTPADSVHVVRARGRLVVVSGDQLTPERGITVAHIPHHVDVVSELRRLMERIVAGDFRVEISRVYPFDEALAALVETQTRHARGKLVVAGPQP